MEWEKNRGFTLIELMLAVAIIGLLSAIAVPKFGNLIDKAREASLKGQLGSLRSALSLYYADNEGIFPWYYTPPLISDAWGMWHLNGKYIGFETMVFHLPRYAGGAVVGARDYYSHPMGQGSMSSDPPDPILPIYSPTKLPFYWVYGQSSSGPGISARISIHGMTDVFTPLLDTTGRAWSSW